MAQWEYFNCLRDIGNHDSRLAAGACTTSQPNTSGEEETPAVVEEPALGACQQYRGTLPKQCADTSVRPCRLNSRRTSGHACLDGVRPVDQVPSFLGLRLFENWPAHLGLLWQVAFVVVLSAGKCAGSLQKSSSSAFLIVLSLLMLACSAAPQNSPANYKPHPPKVCASIEIRNEVRYMKSLEGCEVIEGNLQILLLLQSDYSINNMSFPKLREVTGYIVLWRVTGLISLGKLFPNLAVIRGRALFGDYAFVVYGMSDLMEVGLKSLTNITRGSVIFEKNARLCYVETVDWDAIASNAVVSPLYSENRPNNECGRCQLTNSEDCITSPDPRCWSKELCQKKSYGCLGQDRSVSGVCCHERCLGGCSGPTSRDCFACKEVYLDGECIQECPPNTYKYLDRRCVTKEECQHFPVPRELREKEGKGYPFRLVGDSCLLECPANYTEVSYKKGERTYYDCQVCQGHCTKECKGGTINSIMAAQQLTGCTHITGALELHLRQGGTMNLAKELEKALGSIEVIDEYLKVSRSFPLISLNFFKNLRLIRGLKLDHRNAALAILDNQNLQELWDWDKRPHNFTISHGKLSIHNNPKLCYYKLEKFREIANLEPFTEDEVPRDSNGDKEACNITEIEVRIAKIQPYSVLIKWNEIEVKDSRKLIGYVVSYVKTPYKNVTQYDGRDACGNDGLSNFLSGRFSGIPTQMNCLSLNRSYRNVDRWFMDDVPVSVNDDETPELEHLLSPLKPFTQYAFFVKTVMLRTETNGGQSKILYVTTAPATPTMPNDVQVRAESTSQIFISWRPPTNTNGNLTHYFVTVTYEEDIVSSQHDQCDNPIVIKDHAQKTVELPPPTLSPLPDTTKCQCGPQEVERDTEEDRQKKISFEDALQNFFFVKSIPNDDEKSVVKREVERNHSGREPNALNDSIGKPYIVPPTPAREEKKYRVPANETTFVIKDLKYFARYEIAVQACRAPLQKVVLDKEDKKFSECSVMRITYQRTKKNDTADRIVDFVIDKRVANDTTTIKLRWKEPEAPNGLVHSFKVNGTRVFDEKEHKLGWCVERQPAANGWMVSEAASEPGNYSYSVRAVGLAGEGPFSVTKWVYIEPKVSSSNTDAWVGVLLAILVISVLVGGFIIYWRRINPQVPKLFPVVNPEYVPANDVYIADEWEVPREKIELIRELGKGSFGMVYEGIAYGISETEPLLKCAVKVVNEHSNERERHEFLNEASVMKAFNTHHVVRLVGVVSTGQPTLVVMELMSNGDLKTYLRRHRPEEAEEGEIVVPPTLKRILLMAIQIADGMAYLAAKKFVHRDLAARNCMVAEDLTVKIGDFGMTRDIYETDYYKKGTKGLLPVRWMAPESLKDGVFTSNCDVWSYGVVLWEMVTLASQPYLGLSNDEVLRYVIGGGLMERPENCPEKIYEVMQACWTHRPSARPTFMDIVTRLLPDANEEFVVRSFYYSPEGCEIRAHELEAQVIELEASYGNPRTPLRATTELDDTDDFSSVCSGSDVGDDAGTIPLTVRTPQQLPHPIVVSSSDSSRGSKVSNGSGPVNGIINKVTPC